MMLYHLFDPVINALFWATLSTMPAEEGCYTDRECLVSCDAFGASAVPSCRELCTQHHKSCMDGCKFMPKEKIGACMMDCIYDWAECDKKCRGARFVMLMKPEDYI